MMNVEFKARCNNHKHIKKVLKEYDARFEGIDHQTDIYFKVNNGRLKLRKGNIENALIYYSRENIKGIKPSHFTLYQSKNLEELEQLLRAACGVLIIVKKKREIFYINNIKFNLDEVNGLGTFVEIEAFTNDPKQIEVLKKEVQHFMKLFNISSENLESHSYSDLLLGK
ncbi:MAG: class IV adenylate cyclase [Candidatus Heimdallarchaeota archaeon]|nr:class IV adenylate cyclase [Candidatus Heimdallarchaeota archaeon]